MIFLHLLAFILAVAGSASGNPEVFTIKRSEVNNLTVAPLYELAEDTDVVTFLFDSAYNDGKEEMDDKLTVTCENLNDDDGGNTTVPWFLSPDKGVSVSVTTDFLKPETVCFVATSDNETVPLLRFRKRPKPSMPDDMDLETWGIVGIILAVLVVLFCFWACCCRKKETQENNDDDVPTDQNQ